MTYCPLHDTRHGLPHGRICPDHSCECTWTVEDGMGIRLASRCPIHRDCSEERPYEQVLSDVDGDLG